MIRSLILTTALVAVSLCAQAQPAPVKIGVLTDMTGVSSDDSGPGSLTAARMAIEDHGGNALGLPVEITSGDHQNKADIASGIARQWFDTGGVDMIVDLTVSTVALAVQELGRKSGKITLITGAGATELTGAFCSPLSVVWTFNTSAYARPQAPLLVGEGKKRWFFISVDYAFGKSLEAEAMDALTRAGGTVAGALHFPFDTSDFSSYLLQGQASGADVIAAGAGGVTLVNLVKQATEFGLISGGRILTPLSITIRSAHSIGAPAGQGMVFSSSFYWDGDDASRSFAKRFFDRMHVPPTDEQAGTYSAVTHYLQAVDVVKTKDGPTVMAQMRRTPVEDVFARHGRIREDGLMVHDFNIYQFKTPAESHGEWDLWKKIATVPADAAFRPLAESGCPLVTAGAH
jgi:branched-chain amino acid transport system substrate-binding protein